MMECTYYNPCGLDECLTCTTAICHRSGFIGRPLLRPEHFPLLPLGSRRKQYDGFFYPPVSSTDGEIPCVSGKPAYEYCGEAGKCALNGSEGPTTEVVTRSVREVKQKRRKGIRENYGAIKRVQRRDSVLSPPSGGQLDAVISEAESTPENRCGSRFSVLDSEEEENSCKNKKRLHGRAVALVSFFSLELGIQGDIGLVPEIVKCGQLRKAVRGCFDSDLTVLQELSLKTAQKVEKTCCKVCEPDFDVKRIEWMRRLKEPVDVNGDHLERYKRLFRNNVPVGWNGRKYPYVPNGHATQATPRTQGGNWKREEFSDSSHFSLVFSSGKPRVVTCYSSYNAKVLYPLHRSLYHYLKKRSWLLVGEPTGDQVRNLNGTGDYLSFDYIGATDNIKTEYVKAGIEILIERSVGMTDDEKKCLRVLGDLRLEDRHLISRNYDIEKYFNGDESEYERHCSDFPRGQPMGCFMSFPMLCLTNKTIVDLALTDLLEEKKLNFDQWSSHRCLINGDDLLLREPDSKSNLRDKIIFNGGQVGMETNKEKCLQSNSLAEVNSTLFVEEEKMKKTNAKVLYPEKMTEDFLGMAYESTTTIRGFMRACRANAPLIAKQKDKFLWKLPYPYQAECRKSRKVRKALLQVPIDEYSKVDNYFGVTIKPEGYDLTNAEEREVIERHVDRIRDGIVFKKALENDDIFARRDLGMKKLQKREDKKIRVIQSNRSWRSLIRRPKPSCKEYVLSCLAQAFEKEKKWLFGEDSNGGESIELISRDGHSSMIAALESAVKRPKTTQVSTSPIRLPEFCLSELHWSAHLAPCAPKCLLIFAD
jgi:hypothetical protein